MSKSICNGKDQSWLLFSLPALFIYLLFMLIPLISSIGLSLYSGKGLVPDSFVGLENYRELFSDSIWRARFLNAFRNTWFFFGTHMVVQNSLGLFFATILSSTLLSKKICEVYRATIFLPVTLSIVVTGFLWRLLLNPYWGAVSHLFSIFGYNAAERPFLGDPATVLPTISLVSSWQWVGMPTVLFTAGLLTIPDKLIEAAKIEGASSWQIFTRVKLPLIMPVIGIIVVLTYVGNFNAFDVVYAMTGPRGEPGYAADLLGSFFYRTAIAGEHPVGQPNMGIGAAVAVVTCVVLALGVWGAKRLFRERV